MYGKQPAWLAPGAARLRDRNGPSTTRREMYYRLALHLAEGDGVPRHLGWAFEFFVKAAAEGLPEAQLAAGRLIEDGILQPPDLARALAYFQLAAAAGNAEAIRHRDDLALRLAPSPPAPPASPSPPSSDSSPDPAAADTPS